MCVSLAWEAFPSAWEASAWEAKASASEAKASVKVFETGALICFFILKNVRDKLEKDIKNIICVVVSDKQT